jgi:hypothetical protein
MTLIAILLAGVVVFYVVHPILTGKRAPLDRRADEPSEVEARKRVALLALRDVEYDYATGKLNEADYKSLRGELASEALDAMKAEEAVETLSASPGAAAPGGAEVGGALPDRAALEEEIARYRAALQAGSVCPECRGINPPGSRFCATCGFPLAAAPAPVTTSSGEG